MKKLAILNGPNLDRLGKREPHIYGHTTLAELEERVRAEFAGRADIEFFQSNHEGELVDRLSALADAKVDGVVINGAALTHTSVALRDALAGTALPFIEVHISNVHAREPFRRHSYLSDIARGSIVGLGVSGYRWALMHALATPASAT